jgi:hypothetical protein
MNNELRIMNCEVGEAGFLRFILVIGRNGGRRGEE